MYCNITYIDAKNYQSTKALKEAWCNFAADIGTQNDRPWEVLDKKQLYLVLQMEHGGVDLEKKEITPDQGIGLADQFRVFIYCF